MIAYSWFLYPIQACSHRNFKGCSLALSVGMSMCAPEGIPYRTARIFAVPEIQNQAMSKTCWKPCTTNYQPVGL